MCSVSQVSTSSTEGTPPAGLMCGKPVWFCLLSQIPSSEEAPQHFYECSKKEAVLDSCSARAVVNTGWDSEAQLLFA